MPLSKGSKNIPIGRVEIIDVDLTSLVGAGDADSEANLVSEGGFTAFTVLNRVSLAIVPSCTVDTLRIGELSFIGDPGKTGSSEAGSVAISNGHDVDVSASCGYARVSVLGSEATGETSFFRVVPR